MRCVDSDVHPVPKRGELIQYIPEPWRSKFFLEHKVGELIYYDAPDYAHSYAMRVDTFPPDGEFPGSDPDMAFRQLIMEAGSDIAILEPGVAHPAYPKPTKRCRPRSTTGRTSTGLTATTTGTSAGAGRSVWRSRILRARPVRSNGGPATRTWRRSCSRPSRDRPGATPCMTRCGPLRPNTTSW
ncbi:amidohydrolase family domain protein [Mycobacterium xenopi 4042]|uniref:Amidohydrolase family domain protein n=1 Tax=Mycobacterium xenopi 4042 TaxID=1299334 RepID=X8AGU3_MYCXE|nr:amidohydrolase family domain protein [Mycobacterium xenopi 4042]